MVEMKRTIGKAGLTSPGTDEVCYVMLAHLSDEELDKVLVLYNRVWEEGLLIKLDIMRVGGRMYNWIKDFLFGSSIQVRVGKFLPDG